MSSRARRLSFLAPTCWLAVVSVSAGCGTILGLGDFTEGAGGGSSGTASSSSSTGSGGTGGSACKPQETTPCTTGKLGACQLGTKTCLSDQSGYGDCQQNVQPVANDDCTNKVDANCNGVLDCACNPTATMTCTTGLAAACATGTASCKGDGTGFGACVPDVMPTQNDDCSAMADTNCNGGLDCACTPATTMACMTGIPGACAPGMSTCKADGSGFDMCAANVQPMPEDCTKVGDENCDGIACSDCVWSFNAGDGYYKDVSAVAVDPQGNIFIAGYLSHTLLLINKADPAKNVTLNAFGQEDGYLAKLAPDGDVLWAKNFGSAAGALSSIHKLATDANGNVAFATAFHGAADFGGGLTTSVNSSWDGIVAVYDASGTFQWQTQLGNASTSVVSEGVAFDSTGNVILVGEYGSGAASSLSVPLAAGGSTSLPNYGNTDGFIIKLTTASKGKAAWATRLGEAAGQPSAFSAPNAIAVDGSNTSYIAGTFDHSIVLKGTELAQGQTDIFVAKVDPFGTVSFSMHLGSTGGDTAVGVALDGTGAILVTGNVAANPDFGVGPVAIPGTNAAFLAKYDGAGNYKWAKPFGGAAGITAAVGVSVNAANEIFLAARTFASADFGTGVLTVAGGPTAIAPDMVLAKYQPSGTAVWSKIFGDTDIQEPGGLATDSKSGGPVLGGRCSTTIDFGTGLLTATGQSNNTDLCVAKFQP